MTESTQEWAAHELAIAALEPLVSQLAEITGTDLRSWECDIETEGGQPNGLGVTEPSDYRPWFTECREDHHRLVITITGPWMPGPRPHVLEKRRLEALAKERRRIEAAESRLKREDSILQQAAEIQARRARES